MTDSILTLNSSSALLNALSGGSDGSGSTTKLTDPFTFRTKYNVLSTSKKIVKTEPRNQPSGASPWGGTVNFDVTKMGLWCWAVLEVNLTCDASVNTDSDSTYYAARFFNEIIISAHGSTLMKLVPEAIHALIDHCSVNKSLQYKKMLNGNKTSMDNVEVKFFVPIFGWMFENTYNWLYTNALEDLIVQCTINSKNNTGLATGGAVTATTIYLHSCYRNMTTPMLNSYKSFMFKENKKMQQLAYSFERETPKSITFGSTTSGITFNVTAEKVVSKTYFYISFISPNTGPISANKITSVTVTINGDEVYNNCPIQLVDFDNALFNDHTGLSLTNAGVITNETEQATIKNAVYCINWALLNDNNSYTGGVSFRGNNSTIKLIPSAAPADTDTANIIHQFNMVHQYHRVVNIESNGRLSVFDAL